MGSSGSTEIHPASHSHGVGINPRLEYASKHANTKQQNVLLDAPSLVKLQHGTVRYRYLGEGRESEEVSTKRTEKPHEGPERMKKSGYFYHSKLKDFSDYADPEKEESWKFCYVYKGAERARQKQLYYVFGKGLKTDAKGFIEPKCITQEENETKDDGAQQFRKYHGHMYYDLEYVLQVTSVKESRKDEEHELPKQTEEIVIHGDHKVETDSNEVEVVVNETDTVQRVKRKLAVKMFKPATHFHFYQFGEELDRDEEMSTYKLRAEPWTRFKILLKPKEPLHSDATT